MEMKRVMKAVVLTLVASLSAGWLVVLSLHGPQAARLSCQLGSLKLSGRAPYLTWAQVFWPVAPEGLRRWVEPVYSVEACFRVPVRMVRQGSGPCGTQWETPLGLFWAGREDGHLLAHLAHEQLWLAVYNRPPVAVRQGDVVIDGGAHVGTFSRFALRHGARKVIAFEPAAENVECLKRTFAEEMGERRLIVVPKALWNASGNLNLARGLNSAQSRVTSEQGGPGESVPAITLDEAAKQLSLDRVDFIKLDIEGAQRQALAGAAETIRQFGLRMVVCTYHLPDDGVKVTETVLRLRPSYWMFATSEHAYFYEASGGRP